MGYINGLVKQVREDHQFTQEFMAECADVDRSEICRWELGEREVRANYIRVLFRVTKDQRLLNYIHPSVALVYPLEPAPLPPPGDASESNAELLERIEDLAKIVRDNQEIFKGGIEASDADRIQAMQIKSQRVIETLVRHNRNTSAWLEAAERKAGRP